MIGEITMANPLFQEQMSNNMMGQFSMFMKNPMQFLIQRKINIPQQYANDPHGAVQYLLNNGQLSQDNFNQIMSFAQNMVVKF